jgi:mannose-1-phosphate guanylyltransferase
MKAFILAAGFSTRLLPLTASRSKVTLPLAGVPILVRVIRTFRALGIDKFAVNLHHASNTVELCLAASGEEVTFSREKEILGTGGALFPVKDFFQDGTFLLVNGDCYFGDFPLDRAFEFHRKNKALATMVLIDMPQKEKYRAVEIDSRGRVIRIAGRPEAPHPLETLRLHFPGIHILEPELLAEIPSGFSDINQDIYPRLIALGAPIYGFHTALAWFDLGTPGRYLEALGFILNSSPDTSSQSSVLIGESCSVHSTAILEPPLEIGRGTVIGPGCRVSGALLLDGVVLEKDVVVEESLIGDNVCLKAGKKFYRCVAAMAEENLEVCEWG